MPTCASARRDGGGTEVVLDVPLERGRPVVPLKTRILLADDHAIVRRGLRLILDAEPDLEVVAEAATAPRPLDARA